METLYLSNRKNAQGEWTDYIPGKTLWLVNGQLYTGSQMTFNGISLTPLTTDESDYLESHGIKILNLLAVGNGQKES